MSDSGFKFNYSWEDLRPVHPLFITSIIFQVIGAVTSLFWHGFSNWFDATWFGAAIATFPGFLIGLPVQAYLRPGSISLHRSMVVFLGITALVLLIAALTFPRAAASAL